MTHIRKGFSSFAILIGLFAWLALNTGYAQDDPVHGAVESVSGQTVIVQLKEGYRVASGTEGAVYGTKMTLGEETTVETGQLRVESAEGRRVTASLAESDGVSAGQDVQFASVQKVGTLAVSSQLQEAQISIDGSPAGTGSIDKEVAVGTREVRAAAEGCPTASESVEVSRATTSRVRLQLDCPTGTLIVRASPENAVVFLNDERIGEATVKKEVDAGLHRIRVGAEGYRAKGDGIQVDPGETKDLTFSLEKKMGIVTLTSTPSSALVEIRGQDKVFEQAYDEIGRTPVQNHEVEAGSYDLRISKDGYEPITEEVVLKSGELIEETYQLEKAMGRLAVYSDPEGARVYIDGEYEGKTDLTISAEPDQYEVRVQKSGYDSRTEYGRVTAGNKGIVHIDLEKRTTTSGYNSDSEDYSTAEKDKPPYIDGGEVLGITIWTGIGATIGGVGEDGSAEQAAISGALLGGLATWYYLLDERD